MSFQAWGWRRHCLCSVALRLCRPQGCSLPCPADLSCPGSLRSVGLRCCRRSRHRPAARDSWSRTAPTGHSVPTARPLPHGPRLLAEAAAAAARPRLSHCAQRPPRPRLQARCPALPPVPCLCCPRPALRLRRIRPTGWPAKRAQAAPLAERPRLAAGPQLPPVPPPPQVPPPVPPPPWRPTATLPWPPA
jgi:hypothetical protein